MLDGLRAVRQRLLAHPAEASRRPGAARRRHYLLGVPSWAKFEAEAPELAARVRERLEAHGHKTIATLRRDGSPRISGTEAQFRGRRPLDRVDVEALKARDLQRDPRYALHSASEDPDGGPATRRSPAWPRRSPTPSGCSS